MKRLINQIPSKTANIFLGLLPFLLIAIVYMGASNIRLDENPNDKLLPSIEKCIESMSKMAFEEDKRSGGYILYEDTTASLQRLLIGVGISAIIALSIGISIGVVPYITSTLSPLIWFFSLIPTMAILPILFIVFGLGEVSKIVLIVLGITPIMIRDIFQRVKEIPSEQIIKVQTLGASTWQIITRVVTPQIFPRLIDSIRLTLGTAWIFLISAEAIAATEGLGYRIFLVRRYLAMDVILSYVIWITILAFLIDFILRQFNKKLFPWFGKE